MKTNFTPGPWEVTFVQGTGDQADNIHTLIFKDQAATDYCKASPVICKVYEMGGSIKGTQEMQSNAALIAAAPEMFEALQKIDLACNHLATGLVVWENAPILIQQFIDIAREAMAKAKGGIS